MSVDEIRNEKALALLEFKEAEDTLRSLEKEKDALVADFRKFAGEIERENIGDGRYKDLTAEAAYELMRKLSAARQQFVLAETKKKQFGL